MGHSERSPKRKTDSNTGLTQNPRKFSSKQSNLTDKRTTNRAHIKKMKIIKNRVGKK